MVDDEWSWINSMPAPETPPEELRGPSILPHLNLAILVLESDIVGNDIVELMAEYVAEYARLSMWSAQRQPPLDFKEKFRLGYLCRSGTMDIYRSWLAYQKAFMAVQGIAANCEVERSGLVEALRSAKETLVQTQRQ